MLTTKLIKPTGRYMATDPSGEWDAYLRARNVEAFRFWVGGANRTELGHLYGVTPTTGGLIINRALRHIGYLWRDLTPKDYPFYGFEEAQRRASLYLENMWVREEQFPVDDMPTRRAYLSLTGEMWRELHLPNSYHPRLTSRRSTLVHIV
jgi:hypothetical protein